MSKFNGPLQWRGYNGLVDFGYKKHFRVHYSKNEFIRGNLHINGIESFWGYAKIRLVKFKVLFINDHSNIFDELEFDSEDKAIEGLKRNDFERYADDKESQKFIPSPRPPFTLDEIMKEPKYSSGEFWK